MNVGTGGKGGRRMRRRRVSRLDFPSHPPSLSHTFPSPLTRTLCHHYPMPIASTDSLGEQIHSLPHSLSRGHLVIWSMLQFRRGPWTTAARARWWDGRTRTDAASLSYDSIWQRSASSPAPPAAASHQPRGIISDEVVLDAKVRREERGMLMKRQAGGEDGWTDKVRLYKQARVGTSTGCLRGEPTAKV